jgi:hypothetical protein
MVKIIFDKLCCKDYRANSIASEAIDKMLLNLNEEEVGVAHEIQTILDEL